MEGEEEEYYKKRRKRGEEEEEEYSLGYESSSLGGEYKTGDDPVELEKLLPYFLISRSIMKVKEEEKLPDIGLLSSILSKCVVRKTRSLSYSKSLLFVRCSSFVGYEEEEKKRLIMDYKEVCIVWTGMIITTPYQKRIPYYRFHGKRMPLRNLFYEWFQCGEHDITTLESGYSLSHSCPNELCIKPEHIVAKKRGRAKGSIQLKKPMYCSKTTAQLLEGIGGKELLRSWTGEDTLEIQKKAKEQRERIKKRKTTDNESFYET